MSVVTRFAPSPTGMLHIGSARTALFNWLFTKHQGGKFLLRIEDTDRVRSTEAAIQTILNSMRWLKLDWDGEEIYQFSRAPRHAAVAHDLLAQDKAYYCYCTSEELTAKREAAMAAGEQPRYDGRCRHGKPFDADPSIKPAIRLRAETSGETTVDDQVQGTVTVPNSQLDDMIILRGDGTPTYMLAVVVDDYDMAVTHVIRGDDHFTNTFRQIQLYQACGWSIPIFAHIPMIHGESGGKLSKRHGAVAVDQYKDEGFLPEAMRNYLLRLGWGHGDAETISIEQAIEWFTLDGVGKSPSRFDRVKLLNLNAHYIQQRSAADLYELVKPFIPAEQQSAYAEKAGKIQQAIALYQPRVKTLIELAQALGFLLAPLIYDADAQKALTTEAKQVLQNLLPVLENVQLFEATKIQTALQTHAKENNIPFKNIGMPLRAALTGTTQAPDIGALCALLGYEEITRRLNNLN